jgi:hypothetical protein
MKIFYSLELPITCLPPRNQAEAGLDRMPPGHDALIALVRLLARQAAREFVSQK